MRVVVYDHTGTTPEHQEVYEGSPEKVEIYLRRAHPFLNREVIHGDLEGCLESIDEQQTYSVAVESGEDELAKYEPFLIKHLREQEEKLGKMARLDPSAGYQITHEDIDRQNGEHYTVVRAHLPGVPVKLGSVNGGDGQVGLASFYHDPKTGLLASQDTEVHPDHRRLGVASAMYAHAEKVTGKKIRPADTRTADGHALWAGNAQNQQFGKSEDDHAEAEFNLAKEMLGFSFQADSYFDTSRWMAGAEQSISRLHYRQVLLKHDGDIELAALAAYGLDFTDENLRALRGLVGSGSLAKAEEQPVPPPESLLPAHPDASEAAEEVRRGFEAGTFHIAHLNGKHSGGTMIGRDPETKHLYLLKPGSGDNSPAAGVHEESASQSRREAAFWYAADFLGLGEYAPRADLLYIDGHEVAAIRMLPLTFKNLGSALKQNPSLMPRCMTPYLLSGIIHKWAVMDYVLGNPDRHSQNIMIDEDGRTLRLIDHGSALAGQSFDPAHDENSFIPYYLRAWTGMKFAQMDAGQQLRQMPTAGIDGEKALAHWLRGIDQKRLAAKLQSYGIDPEPMVARLEYIKMLPGPKDQDIDKLWLGVGVEHPQG